MGNQCCSQSSVQTHSQKEIYPIMRQDSSLKSLGESLQIGNFGELIEKNCSAYMFQDGDGILTARPLSPRQQHVIVYLEPKVVYDEGITFQIDQTKGILSARSYDPYSDSACSSFNERSKPLKRVQFRE